MVKKANHKFDTINKICTLFSIQGECKTEEDIVQHISVGDKEHELIVIKLFVDKVLVNKYFSVNLENYKLCKEEVKKLFN